MQPDEREALLEPAEMPPARPGAVTPPEGQPKGTVTSHSRVVTAAKSRVHPLVMERLDVSAASQLPRDDLTRQIGEIVREIVLDEKLNLNAPEQQAIVDIMLDDMLGLGPLEPLDRKSTRLNSSH